MSHQGTATTKGLRAGACNPFEHIADRPVTPAGICVSVPPVLECRKRGIVRGRRGMLIERMAATWPERSAHLATWPYVSSVRGKQRARFRFQGCVHLHLSQSELVHSLTARLGSGERSGLGTSSFGPSLELLACPLSVLRLKYIPRWRECLLCLRNFIGQAGVRIWHDRCRCAHLLYCTIVLLPYCTTYRDPGAEIWGQIDPAQLGNLNSPISAFLASLGLSSNSSIPKHHRPSISVYLPTAVSAIPLTFLALYISFAFFLFFFLSRLADKCPPSQLEQAHYRHSNPFRIAFR